MIRVQKSSSRLIVEAERYRLRHEADRPYVVSLQTAAGVPALDLFCGLALDDRRDQLQGISPPSVQRDGEEAVVTLRAATSAWGEVTATFRCGDLLRADLHVAGDGEIRTARLWQGLLESDARALGLVASGFRPPYERPFGDMARGSVLHSSAVWSARANAADRELRPTWQDVVIDLVDDPARDGGLDSFLPGPVTLAGCLADESWLGLALAAPPEERTFASVAFRGGESFGLELGWDPPLAIRGGWTSPQLQLCFGATDPRQALRVLISHQAIAHQVSHWHGAPVRWWRAPVFDGAPRVAPAMADYLDALAILHRGGLSPGAVWVGPGWQRDGNRPAHDRWPDLRGFIARQHEAERRVILQWRLYDDGAVDADRLAEVLGAAGFDADGLRVTEVAPPGGGFAAAHAALAALRSAAKAVRPDALIIAPTVSPWFADVVDLVPLGSVWTDREEVRDMVTARAELARLSSPTWLLAVTDHGAPSRAAWRELVTLPRQLGVSVTTCVDRLPGGEPMDAEDYAWLREQWEGRSW